MTIFQTKTLFNCAPEIQLEYDRDKEHYHGRVISRTGVYEMSGPDKNDVMYQIDAVLQQEYAELLRSLEEEKGQSQGQSASQSKSDNSHNFASHFGAAKDGLSHLWGAAKPVKFVVMFAGIKISATSKKALKRKMLKQRTKHINKIMAGVRATKKAKSKITSASKVALAARRIQVKRKRAVAKRPRSWESRVARSKNKEKDWKERTQTLKGRIADKKEHARDLWTNR